MDISLANIQHRSVVVSQYVCDLSRQSGAVLSRDTDEYLLFFVVCMIVVVANVVVSVIHVYFIKLLCLFPSAP